MNEIFIVNIYCEYLFNLLNEVIPIIGRSGGWQELDKCEECFEWIKFGSINIS